MSRGRIETQKAAPSQSGLAWESTGYSGLAFQRAAAAFLAMADRLAGLRAAARALPPLSPPLRPNATAAGFFRCRLRDGTSSPAAMAAIRCASWLESSFL